MKYFYYYFSIVILYINTSGKYCELVLIKENETIDFVVHEEEFSHSDYLHDLIKQLLLKNSACFEDLKALAVLNGPGSYTGLRIGLSAAKGFCYALDIPLILLNQLSLLCACYRAQNHKQPSVAAIKYARSGEYFLEVQFFDSEAQNIAPSVRTQEFIENLSNEHPSMNFIGTAEGTGEIKSFVIEPIEVPHAFIAAEITDRLSKNKTDDLFRSEPFYLKKVHVNTPKKRF